MWDHLDRRSVVAQLEDHAPRMARFPFVSFQRLAGALWRLLKTLGVAALAAAVAAGSAMLVVRVLDDEPQACGGNTPLVRVHYLSSLEDTICGEELRSYWREHRVTLKI